MHSRAVYRNLDGGHGLRMAGTPLNVTESVGVR